MGKFLLISLILASTNAFADINKWVDDQGHVHYSDQAPPAEVQTKALRSTSEGDGTDTPAASDSIADQEAALKREQLEKQTAAEKAAQKQAVADQLKANCDNSRSNLLSLQSGVRMMDIKPDGERYYLDDSQRQQRIDKAQQDISKYCK